MVTRLAFPCSGGSRASLVVLSDRKPIPGAARNDVESAIERALHERGGIWLARPADEDAGDRYAGSGPVARELGDTADLAEYSRYDWAHYKRANRAYAERIIEIVAADGVVWVHGDRWLLVPQILRECGHRGPIGLTLDASFPVRRFEASTWRGEVMAALHELDLIGFHDPQWAHELEVCRTDAARRRPRIGVFPGAIGSDEWVRSFLEQLASAARHGERGVE